MIGTIVDVIEADGLWLLQAKFGRVIAETPVEANYMSAIVEGEGGSSPADLVGRRIWVSKSGSQISFMDGE